jgi:hypothetical protein
MGENHASGRAAAEAAQSPRKASILHSAFFILHSPEPPQSHIKATSKPG